MKLRIIGYTDSVTECDCCGKKELKGTFVMANECDDEMYYGRVCGAKAAGWSAVQFTSNLNEAKKQSTLSEMLKNVTNEFQQKKVLQYVRKSGINLHTFLQENATVVDAFNNCIVYRYAYECINITI